MYEAEGREASSVLASYSTSDTNPSNVEFYVQIYQDGMIVTLQIASQHGLCGPVVISCLYNVPQWENMGCFSKNQGQTHFQVPLR